MINSTSKAGVFNDLTIESLLDSIVFLLGSVVLITFHWLYSVGETLKRLWLKSVGKNSCVDIRKIVTSFKKKPNHIVFILGTEEPSYKDFIRIVKFGLAANIKIISFYDHKSDIDPFRFFEAIHKYEIEIIPSIKWGKSFSPEIKSYTWSPRIVINLYTRDDGLQRIVEIPKKLNLDHIKSVNRDTLSAIFSKHLEAPDPDVAIICGPALSYYAFPPWHLRVTQMLKLSTHHNIQKSNFIELLRLFCNCEQRYGK